MIVCITIRTLTPHGAAFPTPWGSGPLQATPYHSCHSVFTLFDSTPAWGGGGQLLAGPLFLPALSSTLIGEVSAAQHAYEMAGQEQSSTVTPWSLSLLSAGLWSALVTIVLTTNPSALF